MLKPVGKQREIGVRAKVIVDEINPLITIIRFNGEEVEQEMHRNVFAANRG